MIAAVGSCQAQAPAGFTKLANVSTTTYTDTTCPDDINCAYVVTALDSAGFESKPATCSTSTPANQCVNGVEVLVGIPATGSHTVTLTWTASTTTGVGYNVYSHVGPFPASSLAASSN